MKPLHQSYSNMGNWKFVMNSKNGDLEVGYDTRPVVIGGIIVITLCIALALIGYNIAESEHKVLFLIIGIGTAFVTGCLILATALSEKSNGPILVYSPSSDTLKIRDLKKTVSSASENVEFSSEKYRNKNNTNLHYRAEFNIIIDGERLKFLSHIYSEKFSPLISFAKKAKIRISHFTDKKRT